ncbi:MAG: Holliday junction resolvase RuvX [Syntrophomonadaceae bacterium]|nr:Holliday junction resolvase RuvX [Syntrophomonadaceae bacterium]
MRIMGLDIGEKRIGIAISDELGWTAQGHSVLKRGKLADDLRKLADLCAEFQVELLVLGFPRNMDGSVGPKAVEVQELGGILQEYLGVPVEYWDERLSTVAAQRTLLEADVSRQKRKEVIDKLAAVNILQGYLDRRAHK